jgi:CRISPR-associated protein Csd1
MLELLIKYARDHLPIPPEPGFSAKDVRWAIDCDELGNFLDAIELGDTSQKKNRGQRFPKCPDMNLGEMKAEGIPKSHFLIETADVIVLLTKKPNDEKLLAKHQYFKSLLKEASSVMPQLGMLAGELSKPEVIDSIRQRLGTLKAKPTDKVTFRIGEVFPVESDCWHDWWRNFRSKLTRDKSADLMRCFASGALIEPARTHPKIRGLTDVGRLATGDVLIGFKQNSFCSFGLEQALNAAVSDDMAATYCAALNDLIRKTGQRMAGTKVIHWFKGKDIPKDDDPLYWLEEGQTQQELNAQHRAKELLDAIRKGQRPDLGGNYYYALTLSGASGRIMVRDWMEGKFEGLVKNIFDWFEDFSIVQRDGKDLARSPKFLAVLGSTVRELDELANPFVAKMWRVAVHGEPIPEAALAKAFSRVKVDILKDEQLNHAGMGLLKAYHVRNNRIKGGKTMVEDMKPYLNENHPHPAYQCGRLLAVLSKLQKSALGDVGAGIIQRYYAAASSTPALVIGRLTRNSQAHLNKLQPGLATWYENIIAGIWGRMKDNVPATLTLEEQTLFALGYYQQMAYREAAASEKENQIKEGKNG